MGIQLRNNPALSAMIIVSCLTLAVVIYFMRSQETSELPPKHWYYDRHTGELFDVYRREIAPVPAPSGKPMPDGEPAGVRAYIFSCGPCTPDAWWVGFLEKYSPEAKKRLVEKKKEAGERIYTLLRRVDDPDDAWVGQETPEGEAVRRGAIRACPRGTRLQQCTPRE